MGKKRKIGVVKPPDPSQNQYGIEQRFDDSEDEFFAGRDKILVDEGPVARRKRRIEEQNKDLQMSDEEVFAQIESDSDSAEASEADSEEQNWGLNKSDYYNADVIETEADALDEEKEARRLQQKQLESMTNTDFGFDESLWSEPVQKAKAGSVVEKLPDTRIAANASKEEVLEILYNRFPEFDLLAEDLVKLQHTWSDLRGNVGPGVGHMRYRALTSYLGAIAMYFAVISSRPDANADKSTITALPPNELREHAVINNLMESRQLWESVRDLKDEALALPKSVVKVGPHIPKLQEANGGKPTPRPKPRPNGSTINEEQFSSDTSDLGDLEMPPVTMSTNKPRKQIKGGLDIQSLLANTIASEQEVSDFGDEEPLTEQQVAEKAKKKKSLQFYASQIAQKANKRGAASREAGGDDDVPHKERLRDKQERLLREAEKRGKAQATATEELGDDSEDEPNTRQDGYYESLVANSKQKKAEKQAKADAYREAATQGAQVYEAEEVGADGKRKITYAIEKNKGLAPKRKKDVRNPRVKKRKKFDEKMKKLNSVRQVYKGGEGRGGYGGELTGIKTNVVKSVKL